MPVEMKRIRRSHIFRCLRLFQTCKKDLFLAVIDPSYQIEARNMIRTGEIICRNDELVFRDGFFQDPGDGTWIELRGIAERLLDILSEVVSKDMRQRREIRESVEDARFSSYSRKIKNKVLSERFREQDMLLEAYYREEGHQISDALQTIAGKPFVPSGVRLDILSELAIIHYKRHDAVKLKAVMSAINQSMDTEELTVTEYLSLSELSEEVSSRTLEDFKREGLIHMRWKEQDKHVF